MSKERGGGNNEEGDPASQPTLSPKQAKVLAFIEKEISVAGRPPSLRDIARHFGYAAVGTVEDHVRALIKKGFLEKDGSTHCGLRLSYSSESMTVPILGAVPAGRPIEAIQDFQGSLTMAIRGRLKNGKSRAKPRGEVFALTVVGESMKDAGIFDGDFIIVEKQSDALDGEIVVAMIDGEVTVKTLEKRYVQGHLKMRLLPANSKFKPIELSMDRENVIQGRVVSVQRFL